VSPPPLSRYEIVIGLEVHTHLKTASKLFSPAPVRYGEDPNHSVHWIDLALPGVLPVLNERVVDLAIRLGLATHSRIHPRSVFSRKNYFYPDLPKGYQISQYDQPVVSDGWIEIELPGAPPRRIGITRAHIEEDAGKSIHDVAVAGSEGSHIDLNRAGVPLLEIVSEPELRSAAEAAAYLRVLRSILRYIEVSDADMEKGQFRCDANVSLRARGESRLGTRTEIKNLNSFAHVEAAIEAEARRQADLLDDGVPVVQATMAWDPERGRTRVLRLKENADDYRYFDDPDLIPLIISESRIESVRASMPELPEQKKLRFQQEYGLSLQDAGVLTVTRSLADFFETAARASTSARGVANWIARDLLRELKERDVEVDALAITPEALARLVDLVEAGRLTVRSGRDLLPELVASGGDPEALMRERGLEAVSDRGLIEGVVDQVLAANPDLVAAVRGGDAKPLNFLMGQVMKATGGKAAPGEVRGMLVRKLRG
jgi:aspartyl-tRNA(Asn)/glutamyl-tRNA(Gln) amidotransferase subunit B